MLFSSMCLLWLIGYEFRGADFCPVHIFPNPNTDSDSVKNSESDDIEICVGGKYLKCAGGFSWNCARLLFKTVAWFWDAFLGLFDFDGTYASFNLRKTYKTHDSVFPTTSHNDVTWTIRCGILWGILWCIARNCGSLFSALLSVRLHMNR